MASPLSPSRVFFSNRDRAVNDSTTDFSITFDTPITNAVNYEVVSAAFPNVMYPFSSYETILYVYKEDLNNGNLAIGIPFSTTQTGGTGDATPVAGREMYIDQRFFTDGTELAAYLNAWIQSLATDIPTQASGLRPFFFQGDNQIDGTIGSLTDGTLVDLVELVFSFDGLTANGSLKMTLTNNNVNTNGVRVASTLTSGTLGVGMQLPSRLGYKLGFTEQGFLAMDNIAIILAPNNQIRFEALFTDGSAEELIVTIAEGRYLPSGVQIALQGGIDRAVASSPNGYNFSGITTTYTAMTNSLTINFGGLGGSNIVSYNIVFLSQSLATICGFPLFSNVPTQTSTTGTQIQTINTTTTPPQHIAPSIINITRTSSVFIASSLSSGESMTSQGRKDVLLSVPLTAQIGAVQQYQSTLADIVINRPPDAIRTLRITMLDDLFQILEPLPPNASVNIQVHFAFKKEKRKKT